MNNVAIPPSGSPIDWVQAVTPAPQSAGGRHRPLTHNSWCRGIACRPTFYPPTGGLILIAERWKIYAKYLLTLLDLIHMGPFSETHSIR
jgi:hypothetical protein